MGNNNSAFCTIELLILDLSNIFRFNKIINNILKASLSILENKTLIFNH